MKDECFWEEYIPSKLRPVVKKRPGVVEYFIGYREHGEDYVCHGPTTSLEKLIEMVPEMVPSVIFRTKPDGSNDIIYEWDKDRWKRVTEAS